MFGAAIKKDMELLARDRGALLSLFLLPVVFVIVFGSMFGGEGSRGTPRKLAAYAVSEPPARAALDAVTGSGLFELEFRPSAEAVREAVAEQEVAAGLVIPAGYSPLAGVSAELVIDEAATPAFRAPIEGALTGILMRAAFPAMTGDIKVLVPRSPPGLRKPLRVVDGFQVSVPGNAVLFGFFLALTVALSFVEERRTGTWRRLLAAPVRRSVLLLAKLVPFYLIGLVQMTFLFAIGFFVFDMQIAGSITALACVTLAVVFAATGLGLFIASFGGTEKQVGGVGSICLLVMGLLGGAMVPRMGMPPTLQQLGLLTPHAWALEGYYDVLIREGTGVIEVLPEIGAVLAFGVVFAAVGALRFRFER